MPLRWAAWAHCQVSITLLSLTGLKKKGSEEHYFDSIPLNYWISTISWFLDKTNNLGKSNTI